MSAGAFHITPQERGLLRQIAAGTQPNLSSRVNHLALVSMSRKRWIRHAERYELTPTGATIARQLGLTK